MRENMSLLEGRQEDLNQTEERARRINEESKRFDESSKKLLWQYWLRKNMIWVVLAATAVILYFLIF
jgi:sugar phosphate permease